MSKEPKVVRRNPDNAYDDVETLFYGEKEQRENGQWHTKYPPSDTPVERGYFEQVARSLRPVVDYLHDVAGQWPWGSPPHKRFSEMANAVWSVAEAFDPFPEAVVSVRTITAVQMRSQNTSDGLRDMLLIAGVQRFIDAGIPRTEAFAKVAADLGHKDLTGRGVQEKFLNFEKACAAFKIDSKEWAKAIKHAFAEFGTEVKSDT
jgi:hypothetical protein